MSNLHPKDDEDPPIVIIIKPKSAFRETLERDILSPAVWAAVVALAVVVCVVFG